MVVKWDIGKTTIRNVARIQFTSNEVKFEDEGRGGLAQWTRIDRATLKLSEGLSFNNPFTGSEISHGQCTLQKAAPNRKF